jgi:hypothetical protein
VPTLWVKKSWWRDFAAQMTFQSERRGPYNGTDLPSISPLQASRFIREMDGVDFVGPFASRYRAKMRANRGAWRRASGTRKIFRKASRLQRNKVSMKCALEVKEDADAARR